MATSVRRSVISVAASGAPNNATLNTVIGQIEAIGSVPLELFDELIANLVISTALVGSGPQIDVYLQRALRAAADPTNDAHWEDYANLGHATNATLDQTTQMPVDGNIVAAGATVVVGHVRLDKTLTAGAVVIGHFGERLRIVEKVVSTGAITTPAVYAIYLTGIRD